ncbi:hypothetical protein [Flavobacterium difficile]|uniref:DUF5723 domain-containing protein n=1 Tax=Flavobacterium difficile TaxID=2709659 RepID=A0ABX0I4X0_9FLAO|nr:hypothetical protein [Flavobacterium difficile]NHM02182.1 hypothetical protein [Flavobacterium difficile]
MKKYILLSLIFLFSTSEIFSQEHLLGITTSSRGGLLNGFNNPAELSNMNMKFDVNLFNTSVNFSNNKLSFNDLLDGTNLEDKFFSGTEAANVRVDALVIGPGIAFKNGNWTYAISTLANIKANIINVDTKLGDAIQNGALSNLISQTTLSSLENQRLNAATWGEIDFSLSRKLIDIARHQVNAGATVKLLFPSAYANFSASNLQGTIQNNLGDIQLANASAQVNLAYSGFLGNDFNDTSNYANFFKQGINGVAFDIGGTYRFKEANSNKYIISAGLAVKNIGGMSYKDDTNTSIDYNLSVGNSPTLDLNQFESANSLTEIETILAQPQNAQFFQKTKTNEAFKVKLPTTINAYADFKVTSKFYATASINQKVTDDSESDVTTTQNTYSIIPRLIFGQFEMFAPQTSNEISGFTSGFGMKIYGFYLGSSSIVTAALNNSKQADIYLGFRFGI